jgi:hypothetical protein
MWGTRMSPRIALALLVLTVAAVMVARGGHELPVYPSYYPHEIEIVPVASEKAGALLLSGRIHAHVGGGVDITGAPADAIGTVESLGSLVLVRVNPASPRAADGTSACALAAAVARDLAGKGGDFLPHPYPVTPFHGDYLHHVDLAEAAKRQMLAADAEGIEVRDLKMRSGGAPAPGLPRADLPPEGSQWDAAIEEVDAAGLVASAGRVLNGWVGPPWVRTGWFHARLLLGNSLGDEASRRRIDEHLQRLEANAYPDAAGQVNDARQLVRLLLGGCRAIVAGYRVKRESFTAEFSAGIENISFDALQGLASPMFLRTVKLKDFPWNGWLALGIAAHPQAAWNPIAGFSDRFGRLMWSAVGDPAVLPSPYDSAWLLNRISDIESSPPRRADHGRR